MATYSRNKALMCKIFPSSLGPIIMRWFDGLEKWSIQGYDELIRAFEAQFVTCSRILTMSMKEEETFRAYSDRYWELYNEIRGDNGGISTSTFKVWLPIDFNLRASSTLKPVMDMNKFMELVEEYKRLEDDQLQDKDKAKVPTTEKKEVKANQTPQPRKDFFPQVQ
ncbi:uncharacterized protein LOC142625219 [Castanea sativa]|uniref:uncharacterized protein LOC142625219 n=1 Tax=Castanea sativa TaxID=21020 RepID=UPI003F6545C8